MYKFILLFLLSSLNLYAITPKLYKAIGDPIYYEIPAIQSLAKMNYFKKNKTFLNNFVKEAQRHKNLGFTYDKKRKSKALSNNEQKDFLNGLRSLKRQLQHINHLVDEALPLIIKKNYIKTYYRLKKTRLSILSLDPKIISSMKKFEQKIKSDRRKKQRQSALQKKNNEMNYQSYIRSQENLKGIWKGKGNKDILMSASFMNEHILLSYHKDKETTVFIGTYSIKQNDFHFYIQERKRTKSNISHVKKVNLKRIYAISNISEKELFISHKDEYIKLYRYPKSTKK